MKGRCIVALIACLMVIGLAPPTGATAPGSGLVSHEEARAVAENWIALIIHHQGNWGGALAAHVREVAELRHGGRVVGYLSRIAPHGFVATSLRRELEPVKAYSTTSDMGEDDGQGMADVIKGGMARILEAVEGKLGPIAAAEGRDLESILEINYRPVWDELGGSPSAFAMRLASGEAVPRYAGGRVLLTSSWHQNDPYNRWCPALVGSQACNHAVVGCIATAGAQIMRYWNWPPYGEGSPYNDWYDWNLMPDTLTVDSFTRQVDAVAELCMEVGVAAGMDYGCSESSAWLADKPGRDMLDAYEDHFRYHDGANMVSRGSTFASQWFNLIKADINQDRPIQYAIKTSSLFGGHSMVCDGWQEVGSTRQYHMNYGWGPSVKCDGHACDWWYTLDALYHSDDRRLEMMLLGIRPETALGSTVSGAYAPAAFPYRYFDRNATGINASFDAGHFLQFLPGVKVTCRGMGYDKIQFRGWSNANSRLFTRGDSGAGVRIYSGHIYLFGGGSIKLH